MEDSTAICALCGGPLADGESLMRAVDEGATALAHAGCVYRAEAADPGQRDRWAAAG